MIDLKFGTGNYWRKNTVTEVIQWVSSNEQAKSAQVGLEFDVYFEFSHSVTWADLEKNEFRRDFLVRVSDGSSCDFSFL